MKKYEHSSIYKSIYWGGIERVQVHPEEPVNEPKQNMVYFALAKLLIELGGYKLYRRNHSAGVPL